jgi:hypothetical protein
MRVYSEVWKEAECSCECSAVQCSAVQCSAVQCSAVQCGAECSGAFVALEANLVGSRQQAGA